MTARTALDATFEHDREGTTSFRWVLTHMIEDPRTISTGLNVIFVAKSIERIGDHAKNISEYVVYMIKGKDVRHVSIEEIEKTVKD